MRLADGPTLFGEVYEDTADINGRRVYRSILTARANKKGCLDVDTVKGCTLGMQKYPDGGCYGECYAYKDATRYGIAFGKSISRMLTSRTKADVFCSVRDHPAGWYWEYTWGNVAAVQTSAGLDSLVQNNKPRNSTR